MEPHVVLLTDICDFIDGIKRSVDGGPGSGVHKHWNITLQNDKRGKNIPSSLNWGLCGVFCLPQVNSMAQTASLHVWSHEKKQMNRLMSDLSLLTFTFCLASITLASKSAGMTLPLDKKKATVSHPHIQTLTRQHTCMSSVKLTSRLCSAGSGSLSRSPERHWLSWWNSGSKILIGNG